MFADLKDGLMFRSSRDTKRAKQLSEYVGTYRNKAVLTITIHQSGERFIGNFDAGEFGQDIIVERTITRGGGSGYKLMKEDGTVLSTKREVLVSILQFLSIQPDNPVQFMQQTVSKTFLHSGSSEKYYEFFARATRLQEYYDELVQIEQTKRKLKMQRATSERNFKTFKECEYEPAKQTFDGMQDALKLNDELDNLFAELLWVFERDAAQELESKQQARDALSEEVSKVEKKTATIEEEAAQHDSEVESFTSDVEKARTEQEDAKIGLKDAESAVRNAQRERADAESEAKGADQGIKVFEKRIQDLRKQIDEERRQAEHRRLEKRRKSAPTCDVPALEAELDTLKERLQPKFAEVQRLTEQDRANVEAANAAKGR
eukprot:1077339-Rhodomonas_salina.1